MKMRDLNSSKQCSKCKEVKTTLAFSKDSTCKTTGVYTQCKLCSQKGCKLYYLTHKEARKAYYVLHQIRIKAQRKAHRQAHNEYIKQTMKAWRQNNPEKIRQYIKYKLKRYHTNPLFRLKIILRAHTYRVKSKFSLKSRTAELLGCTFEEAQAHLVQTAILNYGSYSDAPNAYEVDHILPLSKATNAEEMVKRCHISNLQYLTPPDNKAKSDKLDWSLRSNL